MSYSLEDYAEMMVDPVRGPAFFAAVRECVRPGSVVADIGAGPGVIGIYAAMLGARRVFLIEPDSRVNAALALAAENGVADRIEIIRALSTDISLPERADVIIADLRGATPLYGNHLAAAADMRMRHLSPGGICVPLRDRLFAALFQDEQVHADRVATWSLLPPEIRHASLSALLANRLFRIQAEGAGLLEEPVHWATLEYGSATPPLVSRWTHESDRAAVAHGILCWFDTALTESISFSNSPCAPPTVYGQLLFPFAAPLHFSAGDRAHLTLRAVVAGDDYEWSWSARHERNGVILSDVHHSTLQGKSLVAETLARRNAAFSPQLSTDGVILRELLIAADGTRSLESLGNLLAERFPARFGTQRDALSFVSRHEHLWA